MARKLRKIISGGQTGGDFGGLLAGRELKLETGGTAPRGYRTDVGPNPRLKEYGLGEHAESGYVGRTRANVDNADLTIAFRFKASPGTDKTIGYAKTGEWISSDAKPGLHMGTRGKPVLVITEQNIDKAAEIIRSTIGRLNPEVVNIAGHREASHPGIEQFVRQALVRGIGGSPEQPKVISTPPAKASESSAGLPKPSIPKWVHNNPITKSLVPMIEEAQQAGYTVDFGPTGKRHASGKVVAADVSHERKTIRIDPSQVAKDFESRAWTKPQVEGVRGIEHEFANAGELAKFYLAHELEHTTPGTRVEGKARNENATNQRAMKRMLPRARALVRGKNAAKIIAEKGPEMPQVDEPKAGPGSDLIPHPQELGEALKRLGRKSKPGAIKETIDRLVGEGKVRPGAARLLGTAVVFAQDRIRGVGEGTMVTAGSKPIDERYFEGTPEELKAARTSQRSGSRSFYTSSLPPEIGKVIAGFLGSKEGKGYLARSLRSSVRRGSLPGTTRVKGLVREAQKNLRMSKEMSLERGGDQPLKPIIKLRSSSGKPRLSPLALRTFGPEDAEFRERSPGTPERILGQETRMRESLVGGMTKDVRKQFEQMKKSVAEQNPEFSEGKVNRIVLKALFPHFKRYMSQYGKQARQAERGIQAREDAERMRQEAQDIREFRQVSGRTRRTDSPSMAGPAGIAALKGLVSRFGAPTSSPSPRRSKRTVIR